MYNNSKLETVYIMRQYKQEMTFDRADRIAAAKQKKFIQFFENAQFHLDAKGAEDSAFYFEMIVDHLKDGGELDPDRVQRILGL